MLSKLKGYALAGLAVLSAVLAALWQYSKASHAKDKLKASEANKEQLENAIEVKNDIDNMSDSDIHSELHKYNRD